MTTATETKPVKTRTTQPECGSCGETEVPLTESERHGDNNEYCGECFYDYGKAERVCDDCTRETGRLGKQDCYCEELN